MFTLYIFTCKLCCVYLSPPSSHEYRLYEQGSDPNTHNNQMISDRLSTSQTTFCPGFYSFINLPRNVD